MLIRVFHINTSVYVSCTCVCHAAVCFSATGPGLGRKGLLSSGDTFRLLAELGDITLVEVDVAPARQWTVITSLLDSGLLTVSVAWLIVTNCVICLCLSEETLKGGGPFYLVSMPGEVKDPTCM